ncbi:hypothetical protein [Glutamicibacter halophytocola]|uniref:hypothetical protein n=1 Tax=Glutamicibacter halophytocola TaxID=1933880 RepID=UPI0016475516|nr:hypothetical protein [Glutamicibacter halophytocola]
MSDIKDPEAGNSVTAEDIPDEDQTLDWDVKRFGHMIDHASDEGPATVVAGSGEEEGD